MMRLFSSLSVVMLFSLRISLTSSYKDSDYHRATPNICGDYCRGNTFLGDPCTQVAATNLDPAENKRCEWANDHCCPPYGSGTEWPPPTTTTTSTTTTTDTIIIPAITISNNTGPSPSRSVNRPQVPDICGGYCKGGTTPCWTHDVYLDREKRASCEWANDHCCPPFGDGSQWTTTTTTTTTPTTTKEMEVEDEGLANWEIVLIMLGAIFLFAMILGVCFWFCWFGSSERTNEMNQPWDKYGYPKHEGMKQPLRPHPNQVLTTAEEEAGILHVNPEYESQLKEDENFYVTFGNQPIPVRPNQVMTTPEGVHYKYIYI